MTPGHFACHSILPFLAVTVTGISVSPVPSNKMRFARAESLPKGFVRGMRFRSATAFRMLPDHPSVRLKPSSAPSRMDLSGWTTSAGSTWRYVPSPSHSGHAP